MTNPEDELLDTIETIRQQSFPEIPGDLVRQIVAVERDYLDNRQEASKRIARLLEQFLSAPAKTAPTEP